MKVFDLKTMIASSYDKRNKNVFHEEDAFKTRIIELPAGGMMPDCKMESYVLFYVIHGEAEVSVGQETAGLEEGCCLITEPATVSMKTDTGVRILGVQIHKQE